MTSLNSNPHINALEHERERLRKRESKVLPLLVAAPFLAMIIGLLIGMGGASVPLFLVVGLISGIMYYGSFTYPFASIRKRFKHALVDSIMTKYHPEIDFAYDPEKRSVKSLVRKSKLISGINNYKEEDVITGTYKTADFYISEIKLIQQSNNSAHTKFDGLLFYLRLPNWNLPKSKIQSNQNLVQRIFSGFQRNEKFDFWYDTRDREQFFSSLSRLFPFIAHLKEKNKDVRIHTDGDEMIIMLNSDMNLLDHPKAKLSKTLIQENALVNSMKQINSLIYIVDAFIENLETQEIEEKLELKTPIELERLSHLTAQMDERPNLHTKN